MSNVRLKQHPSLGILVCTDGHVLLPKSRKHPVRWTLGWDNHTGYKVIRLKEQEYLVHRLVAETFLPNPEYKQQVDHIDRNRANNCVENLRWATPHENMLNTAAHEQAVCVREGFGNESEYKKARRKAYYVANRDGILRKAKDYGKSPIKRAANIAYNHSRSATHKYLKFRDGSSGWVPNEEAAELLKLPVAQREVPLRIRQARLSRSR